MINGFGSKFYGKDEEHKDGSYITTEWECIFWIPIYPNASYRIFDQRTENTLLGTKTNYKLLEIPLYKKQVKEVYKGLIIASIILTGFIILLVFMRDIENFFK